LYLDAGNYHTASTYLHDALNEDPSYALAWNNLGLCSESLGYDEEAAGYYRRAIDLDPDTDSHWLCLADLYLRTQRFAQAAALLEESRIDAEDPFPFVTRLCYCYFKMGKRERLLDLLLSEKHRFPSLGQTLLTQYPDMRNDIDLVTLLLK
jgi:Tfp pilus assembly protein PilF